MRTLVTGGAGFIGSHLVDRLVREGWGEIVVVDNLYRGKLSNIQRHIDQGNVTFHLADIRDPDQMPAFMEGAELVYHLGAQSNVMGAVTDVDYSFTTNVAGTYNVLRAARAAGVRRVIFTSSREAYGDPRQITVDEDQPLAAKNTYGASKVAGEAYCRVFHSNYGLESVILRLANVYGPRDFGRVIPLWLDGARKREPLVVYGGQQLIDFVWIDLVVEALLRAARADVAGTPVNVGSGKGTPLLALADRILELVPRQAAHGAAPRLDIQPARSVEVTRFVAGIVRMRQLLRLEPPEDPLFGLPLMLGQAEAAFS